ncbi:histidine kinase [Streptosporangium sp. G11]|uniref:sensor histidine kinase n=1 Tax=Streptosporangium sp. G11 TaxID=3436926 RepID=UPI003EBCBC24
MDLTVDDSLFPRHWSRDRLVRLDALAAVGYAVALLLFGAGRLDPAVPAWAESLLLAGVVLPLAVRRLWPLTVFCVVLAMSLVSVVLLGTVHDRFAAAAFAIYMVALTRPRPRGEPTIAIGVCSAVAVLLLSATGTPAPVPGVIGPLLLGVAFMGGAWIVGRAVRERRAYTARAAEQLAGRAVAEERLRIARELHDVVAHSMSLIAVKAGIANHVAAVRPEEAADALRVIETTSRGALAEMRQLLGVLRSAPALDRDLDLDLDRDPAPDSDRDHARDPARDAPPSLAPSPGLAGLTGLAERASTAGVRVELDVRAAGLPEGVELSVYRIVQEALTNVVRHAAPARCRVSVEASDGEVRVEVSDDGPGRRVPPGGPGHGLIGMRERVVMYGGSLTAGRRPEGGFGISARIPYEKTRMPYEETRVPYGKTRVPHGETAASHAETHMPYEETHMPSGETRSSRGETHMPYEETRVPYEEAP